MKKYFLTSLIMAGIMCLMGTKAWALEKDGDGVYQISTAQDLVDFAALVNGGETCLNAVLLNDIDMAGIEGFAGIGVPRNVLYTGIFDGHGHKISNMTISNLEATDVGLFHIAGGAVLRDFWLDETCLISG
ncbi:MAG: hypothetical protein K5945_07940, partial [Bacteroidaceae bacterium]|nr:hypothetical protein [Bacteroidaceae bacterium]